MNPTLAIVTRKGLGDGLINLIMANNLRLNGFDVTVYNNLVFQLSAWLPDFKLKPWPELKNCEKEFAGYDLVLADDSSILGKPFFKKDDYPGLAKKYVYLGIGRPEPELFYDHTERLRASLPEDKFRKLEPFATCGGTIRFQHENKNFSQVENSVIFCREKLKLEHVMNYFPVIPPPQLGLQHKKHSRRIVLHPFSAYARKNWPLNKFISLANILKKDGFEPAFISSQDERQKLEAKLEGRYMAPVFPTISELAAFIYESGFFVGNDSGPAHLASALRIPTVTIMFHRRNYHWRPDFSKPGSVILPPFSIYFGPKSLWKLFVPVSKVYSEVKKLLM